MSENCHYLSFPDSEILDWKLNLHRKTLEILVDEAIFDDDLNVRRLPGGLLTISDWEALEVRSYAGQSENREALVDMIDVHFDENMVRLRGMGLQSNEMVDWIFTRAAYSFVPSSPNT